MPAADKPLGAESVLGARERGTPVSHGTHVRKRATLRSRRLVLAMRLRSHFSHAVL